MKELMGRSSARSQRSLFQKDFPLGAETNNNYKGNMPPPVSNHDNLAAIAIFDYNLDVPFSFFAVRMSPSCCICLVNYWWRYTCLSPLTSDEQCCSVMPAAHSTPWQSKLVVKRREVTDICVSVALMENDRLIFFHFCDFDKVMPLNPCATLIVQVSAQIHPLFHCPFNPKIFKFKNEFDDNDTSA